MSCGLGEYINFFPCPYPTIVEQWQQTSPPGMGDYLSKFAYVTPQYIGGNGNTGLGDLALTSPGGYFASGANVAQWGAAEWGTAIAGVYLFGSAIGDAKRVGKKAKTVGKKASKRAKSGATSIGTLVMLGLIAGGGYLAYQSATGSGQ